MCKFVTVTGGVSGARKISPVYALERYLCGNVCKFVFYAPVEGISADFLCKFTVGNTAR